MASEQKVTSEQLVTEENFRLLLRWLDANADAAGEKYERIRQRLIKIFVCRGCPDAEELADRTIDRVTAKAPAITSNYVGEPALYFYGVAHKIHLEWLRKQKQVEQARAPVAAEPLNDSSDLAFDCLETCMGTLSDENRALILNYYRGEKSSKIQIRKEIGRGLGISESALQIRASRIRTVLRECIKGCIGSGGS